MENLAALTGNPVHAAIALSPEEMAMIRSNLCVELVAKNKELRQHLLSVLRATQRLPSAEANPLPSEDTAEVVERMVARIDAVASAVPLNWYEFSYKGIHLGGTSVVLAVSEDAAREYTKGCESLRLVASGPATPGVVYSWNGDY